MTPALQFPNSGYRIMVVDDDPAVLAMARGVLVGAGFLVIPATSGEVALSICREEALAGREISLIILDLTLPGGMTGLDVLENLKRTEAGVLVIASSGYFDDSAAQAALRRGFTAILPKPYSAEKLIKVVTWALGRGPVKASEAGSDELPQMPVRSHV